jgi:uncharacterized protein YegP (UPF0339 family)
MQFMVYKDNGGQFHWRMVGEDGTSLAVSVASFGSADDAQRAVAEIDRHGEPVAAAS